MLQIGNISDGALLVDGIAVSGDSGTSTLIASREIEWHPDSSAAVDDWEICRSPIPNWCLELIIGLALLTLVPFPPLLSLYTRPVATVFLLAVICADIAGLLAIFTAPHEGFVYRERVGPLAGDYVIVASRVWVLVVFVFPIIIVIIAFLRYREYRDKAGRAAMMNEHVLERLNEGSIRWLSVKWLLDRPADFVLPRRQELERDTGALIAGEAAVSLLRSKRVAALSYRWLSAQHPDPNGFHTTEIVRFLRSLSPGEQPEGLFWDFASLHQKDESGARTDAETDAFKSALSVMSDVYATPDTTVLQQKQLPADFPSHLPSYDRSGWCTMEQATASLATEEGGSLSKIGHGHVQLSANDRRRPEQMAHLFADEDRTVFVGKGDREAVAKMYAQLYRRVVKHEKAVRGNLGMSADVLALGIYGNNQFVMTLAGVLGTITWGGLAMWWADRAFLLVFLLSVVWIINVFLCAPARVLIDYWSWILRFDCSTAAAPTPGQNEPAAVQLKNGLWHGYTCGVYNGQDIRITSVGVHNGVDCCWRVEYLRGRWLTWRWFLEFIPGVGKVTRNFERLGPTTLQEDGGRRRCTIVDDITIVWPNGYFSGSDLSWRFHDPNEEFDELRKAVTPEVQAKLFSAHRMSGFWLYTMTWLPVPVLDYHHASSDDAFTTVFNIPFLFYCGREYVRRPGTNTFYWHKNGVNMDFEDWACLRSSCLAVHGPGSPPLKPGDPVSGNAIGIRLLGTGALSRWLSSASRMSSDVAPSSPDPDDIRQDL